MKFVIDVGVGRSVEMQLAADGHEVLPVRDRTRIWRTKRF